jgi:hypothetical protein
MKLFSSKLFNKKLKRQPCTEIEAAYDIWNEAGERYTLASKSFSYATDPVLIDAAIYEMKAAEAKMSYALKIIKDLAPEVVLEPVYEYSVFLPARERVEVQP